MSTSTLTFTSRRAIAVARAADYLELTKPRIASLVLVTVAVAAFVASWGAPSAVLLLNTLVGTALVAASASALNQWLERDSDALMARTVDRPLPSGRLSSAEVFVFGALTIALGVIYLSLTVNVVTALLGLSTWVLYVWIYTPLKRFHPANTFVGAVAGALPMLMGCAAVDRLPLELTHVDTAIAAMLFLVLFLWQFPHFMAIAWIYRHDYASAGLQMLPVVDPTGRRAGAQAVLCAMALIPVSLIPMALQLGGPLDFPSAIFYLLSAVLLNVMYVGWSIRFCIRRDESSARGLLKASLIYLPALMALLMLLMV